MVKTLKKKYNELNIQMKVVFWFTFVGFLQRGISIITTPIFTRVLTQDEYGMFSVFSAWFTVLSIVCTLGVHLGAINNALTKMPYKKNRIVAAFQSLSLVVSSVFFLVAFYFIEDIQNVMKLPSIVILFMFFSFIFYEPYNNWLIYKRYHYEYLEPVLIAVIISLCTPILSIAAIMNFNNARGEARIISYLIANIIIPGSIFYYYNYRNGKIFFDKKLWKYALTFNLPLLPHFLSDTILNQTDKIMIGNLIGNGDVGVYHVSYSAASLIATFISGLNMAFVPWQYQKIRDGEYKKLSSVSYTVLVLIVLLLSVLILFAPEVVLILAGDSYMRGIEIIPVLGISVFFNFMYQLFTKVELYFEHKKYATFATGTATVINILLNILWIPTMGIVGAAYATAVSHLLLCFIHWMFYKNVCHDNKIEEPIYRANILAKISVIMIASAFLISRIYECFVMRMIVFLVILAAFMIIRKKALDIVRQFIRH